MASRPQDLAVRRAESRLRTSDGFVRETFSLPRQDARNTARAFLKRYPKAAYMTEVERWREAMTPGEFWSHTGDDWVKKLNKPQPEQPQPAATAP